MIFADLKQTTCEWTNDDALVFSVTETQFNKLWDFFRNTRERVTIGAITGASLVDGEEGCWIVVDGTGGSISANMETGKLTVILWNQYDPLDHFTKLDFEQNWMSYIGVMKWLKELFSA
jgi:hypothetical protein